MIGTGAIGAVFAGIYVDRTKRFEELVKVCWCLSCLFAVAFSQVLYIVGILSHCQKLSI